MDNTLSNKFKFFIPADFEKATKDGKEVMKIKGIASTNTEDLDGEFLFAEGMDLSDFNILNWNHGKNPGSVIGEPSLSRVNERGQLELEGELYEDMPQAVETWQLGKAFKKSKRGNALGFSIEGVVVERDLVNPKKVLKSKILACAVCLHPKNGDTYVDFITKGFTGNQEWQYEPEELLDDEGNKITLSSEGDLKIEKAIAAEGNAAVTIPEDIEGGTEEEKEKKKKKLEEDNKLLEKKNNFNSKLNKSQIFEYIFTSIPGLEIEKAETIYQIITKMSGEKTPTIEDINKAFEFLDKLSKSAGSSNVVSTPADGDQTGLKNLKVAVSKYSDCMNKGMKDEETESEMKKAGYDDDMVKKAKEEYDLTKAAQEKDFEEGKDKTVDNGKGSSEKDRVQKSEIDLEIEKSQNHIKELQKQKEEQELLESNPAFAPFKSIMDQMVKSLNPSEKIDSLQKSIEEGDQKNQDLIVKGFQALGEIFKGVIEQNETLKKSFSDLDEKLKKVAATPLGTKSIISKSYSKDPLEEGDEVGDGKVVISLGNITKSQKMGLVKALSQTVSWSTEDMKDKQFMNDLQKFETGNILSPAILSKSKELGITLVK